MKTIFKKTLSIALMVSMLASLFAVPAMAVQPELPDWEILLDPVYEMDFSPDADGKFYDMPAGFEGRQEVAMVAEPDGMAELPGDAGNVDGMILSTDDTHTMYANNATNVRYVAFSKGQSAGALNTGASGAVDDYCLKTVDNATDSGTATATIKLPAVYGGLDDSCNKYRFEMDWKWQSFTTVSDGYELRDDGSIKNVPIFRFYVGGKELTLTSAQDGVLYFAGNDLGLSWSGQQSDTNKIADPFTVEESGNWIHITVDLDFKDGKIDACLAGENEIREISTQVSESAKSAFANGVNQIRFLGSSAGARRMNFFDNITFSPVSRPDAPLSQGERMGETAYEMDFNPDIKGNFYDSPDDAADRKVVATISNTKIAAGENWEGECTNKITPRFATATSYAEYVAEEGTNNYFIKSVDNETTSPGTSVMLNFGRTFGGTADEYNKYRVEFDWKWSSVSGGQLASAGGATLFNFYTPSGKKLYLKTLSTVSGNPPGGIFFDKQTNHLQVSNNSQKITMVESEQSNKWFHMTFDFDFKNSTVLLTMESEDYYGQTSAAVTSSEFAQGIYGLSMWGSTTSDKRSNYIDNVKVTPIMTKEPTIKADGNKIMWKAVTGASEYKVYASETAGGAKSEVALKGSLDITSVPGYVIATPDFADGSAKYYTATAITANKGESYQSNAVLIAPQNIISSADFEITGIEENLSTAKATVSVDAAKGFDKKIKLIAAVYDGNELVSVSESVLSAFAAGAEGELEVTLNELTTVPTSSMYINFFVWDEDINPVKTPEKLTSAKWREKLENSGHD